MAAGTEKQRAVLPAERTSVRIHGKSVRSLALAGESDIVPDTITVLVHVLHLHKRILEKLAVILGDGEMKIHTAVSIAHISLTLNEMLGKSRANFA